MRNSGISNLCLEENLAILYEKQINQVLNKKQNKQNKKHKHVQTSGSKVMSNWGILKTKENKRNSFLFLDISHNQCSRLTTDSARSQHIWLLQSTVLEMIIGS